MSEQPKRRLPIRWLTVGEIVAVAAVVIAGLGYWDSRRERSQEDQERAAAARERQAQAKAGAVRHLFIMTGTPDGSGARIRLAPMNPEQVIQTQTLIFPTPVREDDVETTGNPRIERGWFEDGLKKARRGKADEGRLPLAIVTSYIEDGETKTDRAIYQLGYSLHRRTLRGAQVELDGLSLARRGAAGDLQASVDALWEAGTK